MFELTKETAVETVLSKRFGKTNPEEVEELNEVNIWYSADEEISKMGICVELKIQEKKDENYQVNPEGIIFSWGDSPIIDERSQHVKLELDNVYKEYDNEDIEDE